MPLLKEQKDATKFILVEFACNLEFYYKLFKSILHSISSDIEKTMQLDLFYYESKLNIFATCLILKT